MKRVMAKAAVAALVTMGGWTAPAAAQQPASAAPSLSLTPAERTALLPVKQAVDARNWAMAAALVPAARSAARSPDARYVLGRLELEIARGAQNRQGIVEAVNNVLQSGRATPEEQAELLRIYAGLSYDQGNLRAAEQSLERAMGLEREHPETLSMLGQLYRNRNRPTEALSYFQRAARAAELAGQKLPEPRYRLGLALAEQADQRGVALELARQLITAYPTPANWRDVLTIFRTLGGAQDPALSVDALRLMRAANALTGERDYFMAAEALDAAGLPAEAKAVIDEGVARRIVKAGDPTPRRLLAAVNPKITRERGALARQLAAAREATATATQARTVADTLLAHGRYAEAAELYQLALTRPGEDPGLINTRLGIALAMTGDPAAQTAFRAATGPRGELGALWSIWLANRPSL